MAIERATFQLVNEVAGHKAITAAWQFAKPWLYAGHRMLVEIRPEKRSDAQNRRLWSMLHDISQQVDWYGQKLTDEEWKDVFTASLKKQKAVPGLDGGFVICGQRTSKMTKAEMAELQTLMEAFGAERGVQFKVWEGDR